MNSLTCGSERILRVSGKTSDLCSVVADHLETEGDGYVPDCIGTYGDYIEFQVCCDCGQMHTKDGVTFKVSDATLREQIAGM